MFIQTLGNHYLRYKVTLGIKFRTTKVLFISAFLYFRMVSTTSRGQIMACKQGVRLLHNRTNVYSGAIVVSSCSTIFC